MFIQTFLSSNAMAKMKMSFNKSVYKLYLSIQIQNHEFGHDELMI